MRDLLDDAPQPLAAVLSNPGAMLCNNFVIMDRNGNACGKATVRIGCGAVFADEKVDYKPAFQPTQNVAIVNRTESVQSVVAGVAAPVSVWSQSRYDNFGH